MRELDLAGRLGSYGYDPTLPVYAAWKLSGDHLAVVFVQPRGTESRVIGSQRWKFKAIHDALNEIRRKYPWGYQFRNVTTSEDARGAFDDAAFPCEVVEAKDVHTGIDLVRRLLPVLYIDTVSRPFIPVESTNNEELIESLTGYRTDPLPRHTDVFKASPTPTWEAELADALCVWSIFRAEDRIAGVSWGPRANFREYDRHVI